MKMNEVLPDLAAAMDIKEPVPGKKTPQGTQGTQSAQDKRQQQQKKQAAKKAQQQQMRPGQKIKLPTNAGDEQEFRITRDMGDEVEIENPEGRNNPNEPNKLVYDKKQLQKGMRPNK